MLSLSAKHPFQDFDGFPDMRAETIILRLLRLRLTCNFWLRRPRYRVDAAILDRRGAAAFGANRKHGEIFPPGPIRHRYLSRELINRQMWVLVLDQDRRSPCGGATDRSSPSSRKAYSYVPWVSYTFNNTLRTPASW